jgi:hypothetical protein
MSSLPWSTRLFEREGVRGRGMENDVLKVAIGLANLPLGS